MNTFDTTYIISGEKMNLTPVENLERTEKLTNRLKELNAAFKPVSVATYGVFETNFVVCGVDETTIKGLLQEFEQKCGLVLDSRRNASILNLAKDEIKSIGKFKVVPEDVALRQRSYTYDKATNQYFIVERNGDER